MQNNKAKAKYGEFNIDTVSQPVFLTTSMYQF